MSDLTLLGDFQTNLDAVFTPSDTVGLGYCGVYGISAARCSRNFAPGMPDAVVVGVPVFGANYVRLLPGTNWIQTMAEQTDDLTFIAVARPTADAASLIVSNTTGPTVVQPPPTTRGAGLYYEKGADADAKVTLTFNQSIKDGAGADQFAPVSRALASDVNKFSVVSGRCVAGTGVRTVKDWTTNLMATATSAFPVDRGSNRFIVGGAQTVNAIFMNPVDIAMLYIYNAAKSDAELAAIYADCKAYFLLDGILL